MNSELKDFVRRALELKASREQIATVLEKAGWAAAEISSALGAFAEVDFVTPAPKRQPARSLAQDEDYLRELACANLTVPQYPRCARAIKFCLCPL